MARIILALLVALLVLAPHAHALQTAFFTTLYISTQLQTSTVCYNRNAPLVNATILAANVSDGAWFNLSAGLSPFARSESVIRTPGWNAALSFPDPGQITFWTNCTAMAAGSTVVPNRTLCNVQLYADIAKCGTAQFGGTLVYFKFTYYIPSTPGATIPSPPGAGPITPGVPAGSPGVPIATAGTPTIIPLSVIILASLLLV